MSHKIELRINDMCFGGSEPDPIVPDTPPETLDQEAPTKKTANEDSSSKLSIGTKKYASPASTATGGYANVSN